jgi:hypothetical protein
MCITWIFSTSGLGLSDEEIKEQTPRFEALFSEFFELVRKFTIEEDAFCRAMKIQRIPRRVSRFDRMLDNFDIFKEFAFKNIYIINPDTLYNGLKTQLEKFMVQYKISTENNFQTGYGYYCTCCTVYV